jgi:pimeloyl-ACP methyl ester carboxylesterase
MLSNSLTLRGLAWAALIGLAGCAGRTQVVRNYVPAGTPRGVIFSVDGAGGFHGTSEALREVLAEQGIPLGVEVFEWSHGYGAVLADQTDLENICFHGGRLADQVAVYRQYRPGAEIYLVGHSAGTGVALAALDRLPPGSVERCVLLAPSVSADYDLRTALRTCRAGIDVFTSRRDVGYLGVGTGIVGTADRRWTAAAGRVGFRPCDGSPEDQALYARLRQHAWDPCVAWTGHHGGHYGAYQKPFLQSYVLPLLTPAAPTAPVPVREP